MVKVTAAEDMGMLPRETEGIAPMYIPVRVFFTVQPEPDAVISHVSVPWPISRSVPPSVKHAPSGTLQIVKLLPEAANLNSCDGLVPSGLPFLGNASACGGYPQ